MSDFNEFLKVLKGNMGELARDSWKEYRNAAVKDGGSFIRKTKADLERWTMLLAEGKLTQDDFAWLVQGKRDLCKRIPETPFLISWSLVWRPHVFNA